MVNSEKALILHPKVEQRIREERLRVRVRHKAHELYVRGGRLPGQELAHWFEAENQVRSELAPFGEGA